ncbi:hypothetical protein D9M73_118310 [compost metagenome]
MSGLCGRGLADAQTRQQAKLDRLLRQRIGTGDHRLAGNDGCQHRENDQPGPHALGCHDEEPVLVHERFARRRRRFKRVQGISPLAQIIEDEAREGEEEPADADRLDSEMAHVGGQRLRPGYRQEHRPEHEQARDAVRGEQHRPVMRREHAQDRRFIGDMPQAEPANRQKPHDADRPEQRRNARRAAALDEEQRDEDDDRHAEDRRVIENSGKRRNGLQPLHRRQHRQSGRDDRIAVEERGPRRAQHQRNERAAPQRTPRQRGQRQHAAFALIVGAHQEDDIFDRDDQDQRPDCEAQHAQNLAGVDPVARSLAQRFAKGIKRAGADIAEHHADRADRQGQQRRMRRVRGRTVRLGRGRCGHKG